MNTKRIISTILTIIIVIALVPAMPQTVRAETFRDFECFISNNEITITKYKGNAANLDIPETINGNPVTKIGRNAFGGCESLTNITIPNSVTFLDEYAFCYMPNLKNIVLPNRITHLSRSVLEGCASLISVTIPNSVTSIGLCALGWCHGLESVTIPGSVMQIEDAAFTGTDAVIKLEHPDASKIKLDGRIQHVGSFGYIEYQPNAKGFTTPLWNGYHARPAGLDSIKLGDSNTAPAMDVKILVLEFNPILPTRNNRRFIEYVNGRSARVNAEDIATRLHIASHGILNFTIKYETLNEFAVMTDGTILNTRTFPDIWDEYKWDDSKYSYNGKFLDYEHYIKKLNLVERRNNGEFDEIWLVCDPIATWETNMVGRGTYWINGAAIEADCKPFRITGLSATRGEVPLECLGHSAERILDAVYTHKGWDAEIKDLNTWERFSLSEAFKPGEAVAGFVHYAPNSEGDYDWGNPRKVWSSWRDWQDNYPNLTGKKELVDCEDWGGGFNPNHKTWWFSCMPHVKGRDEKGYSNNWWEYIMNLVFTESLEIRTVSPEGDPKAYKVNDNFGVQVFAKLTSRDTIDVTFDSIIDIVKDSKGMTQIIAWRDGKSASVTVETGKIADSNGKFDATPIYTEIKLSWVSARGSF